MTQPTARQPFWQRLALRIAALVGWRIVVPATLPPKCIIVGAHHTSSWDLFLTLLLRFGANLRFSWIAKAELFWGPLGWLWRHTGGIPVRRHARRNFVQQIVDVFDAGDEVRIAISPEGTRSGARHWKTGFYYIALGAKVPIVLGFADFRKKEVGFGPVVNPTGDIAADFALLRDFYAGVTARHPDRAAEIRLLDQPEPQRDVIAVEKTEPD